MNTNDLVICVLAYNEEKYIGRAIESILNNSPSIYFDIFIYANGCTDRTYEIANEYSQKYSRVKTRSISKASKINAWNEAFLEQQSKYILFCDGDIILEKNAIENIYNELHRDEIVISSSRSFPRSNLENFEKKFVGFMQLPFKHEFLYGGFYGVNREKLNLKLHSLNFSGLPQGITGEDCFLEFILTEEEFNISKVKVYYDPPNFNDYCKYFARLKWQNLQLEKIFQIKKKERGLFENIMKKLSNQHEWYYPLFSMWSVFLKFLFKFLYKNKIDKYFIQLGPIDKNGDKILADLTRSHSTK